MYKTILVPLDGSMRAEAILPHVEELAHRFGASVILLEVVELTPPIGAADRTYSTLRQRDLDRQTKNVQAYLTAKQGEFRAKGIQANIRIMYGPVVRAIIKTAQQDNADLIAMASHGRSGVPQAFYGSVAAGVLQRIDRPLLLIRSRERARTTRSRTSAQ
jgi:nucleotide-binding universal stress UspA family protein